MDLERKLEAAQESVVSLMEKKEVLEATRHATLVKCLQEVNGALGGIYRRLTSVEGKKTIFCTRPVTGGALSIPYPNVKADEHVDS